MKRKKIAAQLYTVREFCKTPEDIAKTAKKLKEIGFEAVQASGLGPIEPQELKKIFDGEGLICCATHESGKMIVEETGKVIEKLQILDCKYTAYPYPHIPLKSYEDALTLAKALDKAGNMMKKAGIILSYHNHAIEFEKFKGKTILDVIYDESNPENLQGEIDTYWVQYGGGDPVEWCKKLDGRLPLLHLKEYGIVDNKVTMLEIGNGNLNWEKIVKAAKKSGTEWFIIEEDTCRIDPFESLKISLEYLINEV
ncbi:MAG TPA: sugar phosphate isomerase/epimerase [Victivallales bacterium]|nr:sugar phosphate isomerase/epimerase [Victivallales bacterium]HPO90768.1 sugar phosphate isomerase/epimerase [Victivallales bacterium]HRR28234.1 sugar phosphate isomerase/epimerase [Victivallales bacterium]HRU00094.1 sugar phosphate isomerase/epimerase [Victivallales bacterium]